MNHSIVPSQVSWHLTWTDLFTIFQLLHTAVQSERSFQKLIFSGENIAVSQNLQRVWQQLIEEVAQNNEYSPETDLIPIAQKIIAQSTYTIAPSLQCHFNQTNRESTPYQVEPSPAGKAIDAAVLMVTTNFCLWLQLQPEYLDSEEGETAVSRAIARITPDIEYETCSRWQVTLVLDRHLISQICWEMGWMDIPSLQPAHAEQWHHSSRQFWQRFLHLAQPAPQLSWVHSESQLRSPAEFTLFKSMLDLMPIGMFQIGLDGSILAANSSFCQITKYTHAQLTRLDLKAITDPVDFAQELDLIEQVMRYGEQRVFEKCFRCGDGKTIWTEVKLSLVLAPDHEDSFLLGFVTDLSDRRQLEAERIRVAQEIQKRQQRETLLNTIAAHIRSALDLSSMLQYATQELNQALNTDRVVVYQIFSDGAGWCLSEAVNEPFTTIQGLVLGSDCLPLPYLKAYQVGRTWQMDDVSTAELAECHQQMLAKIQVKSMIATSIHSMDDSLQPEHRQLWGLLTVHQCRSVRQWTVEDRQLVEAVANQLANALEQTRLLNQLTHYTQELEAQVSQRTQSLERSLQLEQFTRRLTDCLHREFNQENLFTTVVQGLVTILKVDACLLSFYDAETNAFEVKFEQFSSNSLTHPLFLGQQFFLSDVSESLQNSLLQGEIYHFTGALPDSPILKQIYEPSLHPMSLISLHLGEVICPIISSNHQMGLVLLLQLQPRQLDAVEIELLNQTTNYCAIALRQTSLYRQEHEQRLSATYLRSFLEQSPDVFVEYDRQLRYTAINPAGCALLNRPKTDVIGKTNHELLNDDHSLDFLIQQAFDTAEPIYVNHTISLPNGDRVFETVYAPITDPTGVVQRVIGICRDVTEFKCQWQLLAQQNHQLAETTRIKEEFVATTSHELRTPLTAILGFSNVLLRQFFGELNPKQQEYVERIHSSGQHLLELINDILDLSRLEAGRMELDPQAIYIADLCEAVLSLIQERVVNQGLTLDVELDPTVEWVVADPRRLKQMLLNLLSNAVKFTPEGKIGLKIYTDSRLTPTQDFSTSAIADTHSISTSPTQFVHFQVWDTGIGITEADQRSLFSPFSQIDSSLARKHTGSGLGLVITKKLAELHGGWVSLQSQAGSGSVFTVSLPVQISI